MGANTGPMTLTLDAPMASGKQVPGKYQLFLPALTGREPCARAA
ncbi:MAG: hypothetical protein U0547_10490 [Dehalococcoidia bacterium]